MEQREAREGAAGVKNCRRADSRSAGVTLSVTRRAYRPVVKDPAVAVFIVSIVFIVLCGLICGLQGLIFLALARLKHAYNGLVLSANMRSENRISCLNFLLRHGILCTVKIAHKKKRDVWI